MTKTGAIDQFQFAMSEMLLRYHRSLGISHEQLILLQACIQLEDFSEIEEVTGFSEEKIMHIFNQLQERKIIHFNDQDELDLKQLHETLKQVERNHMPFKELLTQEYAKSARTNQKHIGFVELVPMKKGIGVRTGSGRFLSLKQTKDLGQELLMFAQSMKEDDLKRLNKSSQGKPKSRTDMLDINQVY